MCLLSMFCHVIIIKCFKDDIVPFVEIGQNEKRNPHSKFLFVLIFHSFLILLYTTIKVNAKYL